MHIQQPYIYYGYHPWTPDNFRYDPGFYWNPYLYPPNFYSQMNNAYLSDPNLSYVAINQAPVQGKATWTEGGRTTKCGIPWSNNNYMTTAVSTNSPYRCGQNLRVTNLSTDRPREIVVTVVDTVQGFPPNYLNLHKNAFTALGSDPSIGIIDIEVVPAAEEEYGKWGKLLLGLTQDIYPNYNIVDYQLLSTEEISPEEIREKFEFLLESGQEQFKVLVTISFNPKTEKVKSIEFQEE